MHEVMKLPAPLFSSLLAFAVVIGMLAAPLDLANGGASARDTNTLAQSSDIYIATVRKDGNQSTAVPVWYITTQDHEVLIDSASSSRKVWRIRRGSPVLVWIGARTGPAFIGKTTLVRDKTVEDEMIKQIPGKYFLARIGLFGPKRAKFDSGQIVTIRISPVRDLPDGFQSRPGTPAPPLEEKATSAR
jgi:hypothetical protein